MNKVSIIFVKINIFLSMSVTTTTNDDDYVGQVNINELSTTIILLLKLQYIHLLLRAP